MTKRTQAKVLWTLCFLFLALTYLWASGCAHLQTHEGKCDESLKKYNNLMTTYRTYYPVQPPETQAKWKSEIAPKLDIMSKAVDLCPTDVTGYNTAMMVYDTVEKMFIQYSIAVQEEGSK